MNNQIIMYPELEEFKTIKESSPTSLGTEVNKLLKKGWIILRLFEDHFSSLGIRYYYAQMGKLKQEGLK